MDCTLPGSSAHRMFQARILEWVAISFSRVSSRPRDRTWVSCTAGRFFTFWAVGLTNSILFGSEWFQWVCRIANTVERKEEREGEGGGREMKEKVKGMHSMIMEKQKENSSASLHEHWAAFGIYVFYKPCSILFKICNRKWDLHPLKLVWRNKCFFLWQLLLGPIIGTGRKW